MSNLVHLTLGVVLGWLWFSSCEAWTPRADQAIWFNTNPASPQGWRGQGMNREILVDVSDVMPAGATKVRLAGKLIIGPGNRTSDRCQLFMWLRPLDAPWGFDDGHALQPMPGASVRTNVSRTVRLVDGRFSAWFDGQILVPNAAAWSSAQAWQAWPTYCSFGADFAIDGWDYD